MTVVPATTPRFGATVGILAGGETPASLRRLLVELATLGVTLRGVDADAAESGQLPQADVWVWRNDPLHPPEGSSYIVWIDATADDRALALADAAYLVVADDRDTAVSFAKRGVWVPAEGFDGPTRPVLPALRRRIRHGLDVVDPLILDARGDNWGLLHPFSAPRVVESHERESLLGISDVVICDDRSLLPALSWAAAVITDPATARAYGLSDMVGIAKRATTADAGRALAAAPIEAAALAWRGHRWFRYQYGWRGVLQHIVATALSRPHSLGIDRATLALASLGLPNESGVRVRLEALIAGLPLALNPTYDSASER